MMVFSGLAHKFKIASVGFSFVAYTGDHTSASVVGPGICGAGGYMVQGSFVGAMLVEGSIAGAMIVQGSFIGGHYVEGSSVGGMAAPLEGGQY